MNDKEKIKEINQHISDALKQWSDIMILADADKWAFYLEYTDEDLLNALIIFNHVAQNKAIKSGHIKDGKDVLEKMSKYKEVLKECFGFDSFELTNKVLKDGIDTKKEVL